MSYGNIATIMGRIKAAEPASPIAVFDIGNGDKLDAIFASTVYGASAIDGDPGLLGIWNRYSDLDQAWKIMNDTLAHNRAVAMEAIAKKHNARWSSLA